VGVADDEQATMALMARARQIRAAAGIARDVLADHAQVPRSVLAVWERNPAVARLPEHAAAARRWTAALAALDAARPDPANHANRPVTRHGTSHPPGIIAGSAPAPAAVTGPGGPVAR
jgi:hypothetical protein